MNDELIEVVITSRVDHGKDIAELILTPTNGLSLPDFKAGAHIDLHIDTNIIRQYSLCGMPGFNANYRVGVLNDPNSRGGSKKIFEQFLVGNVFNISKPRNHFELSADARYTILVAGGIGITPMLAMAYELTATNQPFELHYCSRSRNVAAFQEELKRQFPQQIHFHYDNEEKQQYFSPEERFVQASEETHIYVCGPTGFMDWVIGAAKATNLSSDKIHFEYFSAEVETSGKAFEVYCKQSDITVQVAEQQTIAKALLSDGVRVDVSCEEGVCGTCITDVLEGVPDHRDHFLTDEEKEDNDQIALCCSRSKSARLVLDL